ncbi:class I SAM-dependent methyltransferase [Croceitalea marina]|uniref:Class I SAM-dependent methyltransferase n=1 Tax=Croceitalea marina TaxID=1775166 RepID=A0ABW5MZ61_9FLAO
MNKSILNTGVQEFIQNNWNADIMSVLLKKQQFEGVSQKELAEQLEAKKKCQSKLPTWFTVPLLYYPNKLNIEQTSSEQTAEYKASLVHGKTLLDVTGGLGVDSYFFSKKMSTITHCELDQNLSKIATHNFKILDVKNITFKAENGVESLRHSDTNFDWVFADPSRRNEAKGKVFLLKDCLPNIPDELDAIFEKTKNVLIKSAPLLDIKQGILELQFVKEIHVVAVKNEVKELLWILEKEYEGDIKLKTVNLLKEGQQHFNFKLSEEKKALSKLSLPATYLYEPNAAILKSGGFKSVGKALGLQKLHEHSHLYTSDTLVDFPGRVFKIKTVVPYNKKAVLKLAINKANVTTRNFPEAVATIRKKLKIKDGGEDYLFFTTDINNLCIVIHCQKV